MRRLLVLLFALLAAACYAELDWRELHWEEGRVKVLLPAKPAKFTRDVTLAGAAVPMQMLQVQLSGMAFGVAYAPLPGKDVPQVLAAARDVLVKNIEGHVVSERTVDIPGSSVPGLEFRAEGVVAGTPMLVAGRLAADAERFYEVVFVGRKDRAEGVDLDLFLASLRIVPR